MTNGPTTGSYSVCELQSVSPQTVARLGQLVRQLSSSAPALTRDELESIVASPTSRLLVAQGRDEIVLGMLTLVVFRIPTGVRGLIEDVVVDEADRGRGVGRALTGRALELAQRQQARTVDLTSRPTRVAANQLYLSMGFELRETNVYRFTFT